jgi:tetratricopeptide (TPR) repeat protein
LSPQLAANFINLLIMSLHESGQSEEALRKCDAAIAQEPDNYTVHMIKSEILADRGQIEEGITLLNKIIEKGDATPQIYLSMANIYMDAKEYSKAEESLLAALKVFPEHEDLTFTLGATYEKMGRSDLAEEIFKKIINKNPDHDKALNYLGYMLAEKGIRLTEAIDYIKRALEIDSTNGSYLDSLGWAYYQLNKLNDAKKYLELAAKKEPRSAEIRNHLGDLYYRLGKLSEAIKHWQDALGLKPEHEQLIRRKIENAQKIQQ